MPDDRPPMLDTFSPEQGILFRRVATGGWVVTEVPERSGYDTRIIGAFTNTEDMLRALILALNPIMEVKSA